jgi:hypothetical protein
VPSASAASHLRRRLPTPRSSSASNAGIEGQRASGSTARPRSSARRNHAGAAGAPSGIARIRPATISVAIAASAGASLPAASNGRSPYSTSHADTQKLN